QRPCSPACTRARARSDVTSVRRAARRSSSVSAASGGSVARGRLSPHPPSPTSRIARRGTVARKWTVRRAHAQSLESITPQTVRPSETGALHPGATQLERLDLDLQALDLLHLL